MVLGVFFSEVGYELLGLFSSHDHVISGVTRGLRDVLHGETTGSGLPS